MMRILLFLILLAALQANAKDVTQQVVRQTDLDEKIAKACKDHCQGNRRKGRLVKVTSKKISENDYQIKVWANLKNHHHVKTVIGGGFAAYEYTIKVIATGTMNKNTCILKVTNISLKGDELGLSSFAKKEEGKTHHIANCQNYI